MNGAGVTDKKYNIKLGVTGNYGTIHVRQTVTLKG